MNISTGGPHILLFERDQQLTGLLISEFQLAGYECHTARTAVEVFDAIARQPIRLILVNLAQAAAARREFWVALDTQRRGRGVQVLTFHCTNIANYGPKDPDEHVPTMVDLEVDGMMGIMNLVDAVRARVPVGTSNVPENTLPRILRSTGQQQMSPQRSPFGGNAHQQKNESAPARNFQPSMGQTSNDPGFGNNNQARMQPATPNILSGTSPASGYSQANTIAAQPTYTPGLNNNGNTATQAGSSQNANGMTSTQTNAPQGSISSINVGNSVPQPTYTEKIRAVLYPNQRAWSPPNTNAPLQENRGLLENTPALQQAEPGGSTVLQRLASGQIGMDGQRESGLAQLSRMVQERNNTQLENSTPAYQLPKTPPPPDTPIATPNIEHLFQTSSEYMTPMATQIVEPQTENLSMHTLRASPIQDLPVERGGTEISKRPDLFTRTNYTQQATSPQPTLASISAATQEEQEPVERGGNNEIQKNIQETLVAKNRQAEAPTLKPANETTRPIRARVFSESSAPSRSAQENVLPTQNRSMQENTSQSQSRVAPETTQPLRAATESTQSQRASAEQQAILGTSAYPEQTQSHKSRENTTIVSEEENLSYAEPKQHHPSASEVANGYKEAEVNKQLLEKAQAEIKGVLEQHVSFDPNNAPSNALLLDIMQSLPPMPSPPQQIQAQVLSGRATRSLGSVLLEGHLVPQNRLEVAQNVQRMLRGVDLNYQLGEILLMFKLLTPDQLLAASLVSYGMINPTQITALGRIRQELHAIGMEYDLENLLIMFRILTPEQLREVRASW